MKKKIFILSIVFLTALQGCKKDAESEIISPSSTGSGTIYYKDLTPDALIQSYLGTTGSGPYTPYPSDSIATYYLDIDSNGISDIRFEAKANYYPHPSPHYDHYHHSTWISSLSTEYSLGCPLVFSSCTICQIKFFSLGDPVNSQTTFGSSTTLGSYGTISWAAIPAGDKYLPFKRVINNKTMYGWIRVNTAPNNGVIIKDYALNTTSRQITCGQKN